MTHETNAHLKSRNQLDPQQTSRIQRDEHRKVEINRIHIELHYKKKKKKLVRPTRKKHQLDSDK